jgi:uncharacterized membrane protein YeaQ/YmgE (transglycosylase-associated protein family)
MNHEIIVWVFLGTVAGLITGKLAFGHGFGSFVDAVAGACGAFWGFTVSRHMGLGFARKGLVGALAMSIVGAIVFSWALRVISRRRHATHPQVVLLPPSSPRL